MSETKLSSDEVPGKFADWLLAMGCPPEKVPPVEKISQMCRGTYYLVWRSLMEQVESKDTIRQKRLQVFADDVRRCKKKNLFTEQDTNVLLPQELTLWQQQVEVRRKVAEAEARVAEARRDLNDVMDKVSSKISHRDLLRQRVQGLHRRGWLLQLLAEELRAKKQSLAETHAIAEDMCSVQELTDVQPRLERCMQAQAQRRQPAAAVASSTMIGHNPSASVVQNGDVDDEHITQLAQCRGDVLWSELYARRAALLASLTNKSDVVPDNGPSFQSVLSGTAALQCTLALEALKCREMARLAQGKLADAVNELNTQLTSESCELLVLRCERSRSVARVAALQAALASAAARAGPFRLAAPAPRRAARAHIDKIDKAIEIKKDEIKSVVAALGATERKIQSVRECLVALFNGFKDVPSGDGNNGRGAQLELSNDTIASLRQFYEKRRAARRNRLELSMEFDTSECSFSQLADASNARFIDELRVYLKKFNLEKNRKLVLESGEKIWVFETVQSSVSRLLGSWQAGDAGSALLSAAAPRCLAALARRARSLERLRTKGGERPDMQPLRGKCPTLQSSVSRLLGSWQAGDAGSALLSAAAPRCLAALARRARSLERLRTKGGERPDMQPLRGKCPTLQSSVSRLLGSWQAGDAGSALLSAAAPRCLAALARRARSLERLRTKGGERPDMQPLRGKCPTLQSSVSRLLGSWQAGDAGSALLSAAAPRCLAALARRARSLERLRTKGGERPDMQPLRGKCPTLQSSVSRLLGSWQAGDAGSALLSAAAPRCLAALARRARSLERLRTKGGERPDMQPLRGKCPTLQSSVSRLLGSWQAGDAGSALLSAAAPRCLAALARRARSLERLRTKGGERPDMQPLRGKCPTLQSSVSRLLGSWQAGDAGSALLSAAAPRCLAALARRARSLERLRTKGGERPDMQPLRGKCPTLQSSVSRLLGSWQAGDAGSALLSAAAPRCLAALARRARSLERLRTKGGERPDMQPLRGKCPTLQSSVSRLLGSWQAGDAGSALLSAAAPRCLAALARRARSLERLRTKGGERPDMQPLRGKCPTLQSSVSRLLGSWQAGDAGSALLSAAAPRCLAALARRARSLERLRTKGGERPDMQPLRGKCPTLQSSVSRLLGSWQAGDAGSALLSAAAPRCLAALARRARSLERLRTKGGERPDMQPLRGKCPTLQSSVSRLLGSWQAGDAGSALLSAAAPRCLAALARRARSLERLRTKGGERPDMQPLRDINKKTDEEDRIIDKVKKRLDENLRSLQKTSKTLDQGRENLDLWSDNKIKNHISRQRTVDGKPYKAYEAYYLESLNF